MIKKIRWRLALVNAALIFLVLTLLGGAFYTIMRQRLFTQFDTDMSTQARSIVLALAKGNTPARLYRGAIISNPNGPEALRLPLAMFLWTRGGKLVSTPPTFISRKDVKVLRSHRTKAYDNVTLGKHHFRVINQDVVTPKGRVTLQLVRNMDQLSSTLHDLLLFLVLGTFGVLLAALASGIALADRALVPIRRSWDKQTQFVADASHELRTPLMAIQARAELLLRNPERTIDESAESIADIYQEAKRVSRLVDSLLTLARSDTNQLELNLQDTSLTNLLRSIIDSFQPLCESQDVKLTLDCPPDLICRVDDERFRQLAYILLDNALKYNRTGGSIHVEGGRHGRGVFITVEDTGIGISEPDLPNIFNRFYRADEARSAPGAGLGLAMAQWIVEAHHGQITASSTLGEGTQITVLL